MEPPRQKWSARLFLVLGVLIGLVWFRHTDFRHKVSTDVLDLVPAGERSPELSIVRSFANDRQAKVALFALDMPATEPRREKATAAFLASLRGSPAFAEAVPMNDGSSRDALGREVFEQRFNLLLPGWLAARQREYAAAKSSTPWPDWLSERVAADLEAFLGKPEALAFQDELPSDPMRLVPQLVESARNLEPTANGSAGTTLIWARATASPLREEGQQPVLAAVDQALAAARQIAPEAKLRWTSIARFAAESRLRIEHELSTLNLLSLAGVFAMAALCLRRMFKSVNLVPVILGGLLAAWIVTTSVFDRVHALVFVVGSLLGGVAIDYGFYLYLQPPAFPGEPYRAKARRLLKPLLASALTTIIGFSLLVYSELPLIRQLGVFVSAGLLGALATALLWFAQLDVTFMATRAFARFQLAPTPSRRRVARWLLAAGALVALSGPFVLRWHDDIRDLEISSPQLNAEAGELRAAFGENDQRTVYITYGADVASARQQLAQFAAWHAQTYPRSHLASLGLAIPTRAEWDTLPARLAGLVDFAPRLRAALTRHGFDADAFDPFFTAWQQWTSAPRPTYRDLVQQVVGTLKGPLASLVSITPQSCWFVSIAEHPATLDPPAATATVSTSQLETLNRLFGRYRSSALRLSALGLTLVGLSVFVLYGSRRGARMFAIPSGACLFTFGVLGLTGHSLNLFHLLGAFLGVCLSHNYAIFSAENAARGEGPPPSIRLSALCTAVSFGVLSLSQIPVVAALGTTVSLIVLAALAIVELESLVVDPTTP